MVVFKVSFINMANVCAITLYSVYWVFLFTHIICPNQ